jgi:transposase InsO family protein
MMRPRRGRTIPLLLSPARRRACVEHVRHKLRVPERRVCRALGQHRSTQRKLPRGRDDEERLTADIVELARRHGRYGYRKVAELLRSTAGWVVNDKRVERRLRATDVVDVLSDLFVLRGVPGHVRSDDGPEFVAKAVQEWITAVGAKTAYTAPGSPWENGHVESFNARLRDELLDGEVFYGLREAQVVIESWRRHHDAVHPHASLGYRAPAPEVFVPVLAARPAPPATLPLAPRPALH